MRRGSEFDDVARGGDPASLFGDPGVHTTQGLGAFASQGFRGPMHVGQAQQGAAGVGGAAGAVQDA